MDHGEMTMKCRFRFQIQRCVESIFVMHRGLEPNQLRQCVCDTIAEMRGHFEGFQNGISNFDEYLAHMRLPDSWGDHVTLQAAAFYLRRPIVVISDHFYDTQSTTEMKPPVSIAKSACDMRPIVLAFIKEFHYETTELLEDLGIATPTSSPDVHANPHMMGCPDCSEFGVACPEHQ